MYQYTYGNHGEISQVIDKEREVTVRSEYDLSGRPAKKTITKAGEATGSTEHVYTGEVKYDEYGNVSEFKEKVGADKEEHTTSFEYDEENKPTRLTYDETSAVNYTYDALGRVSSRCVGNLTTTYTYVDGDNSTKTTQLVRTITQLNTTLTYTYDANCNITSVSDGTATVSYTYDKINQLVRANDPYDKTAGDTGTTWIYCYDLGGNILTKQAYAYTTGNLCDAQPPYTYTFTYGNQHWRDQLTVYNNQQITYDAIGNPLRDGTWTYTWQHGRQLRQMQKIDGSMTVQFEYNEDGLLTKKSVNGIDTLYFYHGKKLVHMTKGNDNLHFYYDAQNCLAFVEWNGVRYAYVKNLQGDIISIVDMNGNEAVRYSYDAWGKSTLRSGQMTGRLGSLQPFRYRGYAWQEQSELYYLRSRCYHPEWSRFINSDTIVEHNLYCYCSNSPLSKVDTHGTCEQDLFSEEIYAEEWHSQVWERILQNIYAIEAHSDIIKEWKETKKRVTVSELFGRLNAFIDSRTNFRSKGDSGCGMFIRAGILGKRGVHGSSACYAGASSMFNHDMIVTGNISDVGGPMGLVKGMILGTAMDGCYNDGQYHVQHVGVYAGYGFYNDQYVPLVYSFNTDTNKPNLVPFSKNDWVYYGWHYRIEYDE